MSDKLSGMRLWAPMLFAATVLLPATAGAVDGIRPRTPMEWPADTPCMGRVDRTVDPIFHIDYEIPFEDPMVGMELTEDEVEDGRRHQFIAKCKQRNAQTPPPVWLSQADVDAAAAVPTLEFPDVNPQNILENVEFWQGCYEKVNADADRLPITFEMADMGVDWTRPGSRGHVHAPRLRLGPDLQRVEQATRSREGRRWSGLDRDRPGAAITPRS